jgi:hypothetical protein
MEVPAGCRFLTEGSARILYIDSKMPIGDVNMITRIDKHKWVANEVNKNRKAVF